jgi:hypothetical protein
MRKRLTYTNVVATMALVFAMSGGAFAASHYLVNSTKQINPKVLKKLKGNAGPKGATGKEGAPGKEGLAGKDGGAGVKGEPGPTHAYTKATNDGSGVASITVPAGTYVISGDGDLFDDSAKVGTGECILTAPGFTESRLSSVSKEGAEEPFEKRPSGSASIANSGAVTLAASGTIEERCVKNSESQPGSTIGTAEASVTAIEVGGLN